MNRDKLLSDLSDFPLYDYRLIDPGDLVFTERVRHVCSQECPMYNHSWACPPAVGEVAACKEKCMRYPECLLISTITEVSDIANIEETLSTRAPHEAVTRQVRDLLLQDCEEVYVLSTEACAICERCAWPAEPCRHPEKMFPCVESHGILVTELAERLGIDFLAGSNLVTWFSLLFFR